MKFSKKVGDHIQLCMTDQEEMVKLLQRLGTFAVPTLKGKGAKAEAEAEEAGTKLTICMRRLCKLAAAKIELQMCQKKTNNNNNNTNNNRTSKVRVNAFVMRFTSVHNASII